MSVRNRLLGGLMAAMLVASAPAVHAQPQGGSGMMGPGMMGPGMMGGGQGYGYGPGMMGPGMMGGSGMGPGMMGGYGMGPGMMGGYGMGPGMMGGYGPLSALNLTDDQRKKVQAIYDDLGKKNWEALGKMREDALKLRDLGWSDKRDKQAVLAAYKRMQDLRLQSFQARLDAQEQIEGVLTKEQRDQLRRWGPWWMGDG